MRRTSVLIIGAGPTGLMMAAQLVRFGIPCIVLDKEKGPTDESRAIGIQARTLEIFQQMGIAKEFVDDGYKAKGLSFIVKGKTLQHVPLSGMGKGLTEFPFLLIHEQQKTEKKLVNFIRRRRHDIEYGSEVLSFTQDEKQVITTIKNNFGYNESIASNYIVGCDGAHSTVRHQLGIQLAGKTYRQSLFVLDCNITGPLSRDDLSVVVADTSFAAFFPMTENHWRVVGEIPKQFEEKDSITFDEIKESFPKEIQLDVSFSEPRWISLYHSHHRCVAMFRKGRAFLVGDAAHIHSPIGAQGMNTGFQDAYNLAWKIAFVEKGFAKEKILDTYNTERIAFAKKLVETTDRLFNLIASTKPYAVFFREKLMPRIVHEAVIHKKSSEFAFRTVSQIGISYHHSPFSENATFGNFPKNAPTPGDRLPYLVFHHEKKKINIQEYGDGLHMQLILFTEKNDLTEKVPEILHPYKDLVQITEIPFSEETKMLYKQMGILKSGFYLIRPDSYIAYRSQSINKKHFLSYLEKSFRKN